MSAAETRTPTPGIYRRGNRYVVRYRDRAGRSHRRFARTMSEAKDLQAQLRADRLRGPAADRSVSFKTYAAEWIGAYAGRSGRGLRAGTLAEYKRMLNRDVVPYFAAQRLADVTPRDVRRFADHVAARGVAADTVRLSVAVVKLVLASAVDDGIIIANPAASVRVARVRAEDRRQQRALTTNEVEAIISHTPPRWRLLVRFMSETGLRIGEVVALEWDDLDLGHHHVYVHRRIYRGRVGAPKTAAGVRRVPLSDHLVRELWEARKRSRYNSDGDPVFASRSGTPLNPANISKWFKPAVRAAGVEWASPHSLRHYCATELARSGFSPAHAAVWLGHADIRLTLQVYTHLTAADLPASPFGGHGGHEGDTHPADIGRDGLGGEAARARHLRAISS